MAIEFTDDEIATVRNLINDFGFEYGLESNIDKVIALARKIGGLEDWLNIYTDYP